MLIVESHCTGGDLIPGWEGLLDLNIWHCLRIVHVCV